MIIWNLPVLAADLYPIIPKPNKMVPLKGEFVINANTTIYITKGTEALQSEAAYFAKI